MRTLIRLAVLGIALALAVQASPVFAVPGNWSWVDVTLQAEQQQPMLLVAGTLPESVKLPYEGELAVPAGTQIQWAGEILGGDASKDPTMKYSKVSSEGGMDRYRFTLTKSRTAQIEGLLMGATSSNGAEYLTKVSWTAPQPVPEVRINARIPSSARIVRASDGAALQPSDGGFSYYSKTVKDVAAGQTIDLDFSYEIAAAGASGAGSATGRSDSGSVTLIVLGALGGLVALAYGVRGKLAARADDDAAEDDDDDFGTAAEEAMPEHSEGELADERPSEKPNGSRYIAAVLVVGAIIVAFMIAARIGTTPPTTDGKITRSFGSASACQATSLVLAPASGVDLAQQGEQVINAFQGMEGIGDVTLDVTSARMDVAWCESSQSEATVAQALASTGLVSVSSKSSAPISPSSQ